MKRVARHEMLRDRISARRARETFAGWMRELRNPSTPEAERMVAGIREFARLAHDRLSEPDEPPPLAPLDPPPPHKNESDWRDWIVPDRAPWWGRKRMPAEKRMLRAQKTADQKRQRRSREEMRRVKEDLIAEVEEIGFQESLKR
jgi:hypothetical protein